MAVSVNPNLTGVITDGSISPALKRGYEHAITLESLCGFSSIPNSGG